MAERAQQDTDIVGKAKSCNAAPTENGLTQTSHAECRKRGDPRLSES